MRSAMQYCYHNIFRWDGVGRTGYVCENSKDLPTMDKVLINLHEVQIVNKKDKFVVVFLVELLSGQRVAPKMASKGSYKTILVVKKSQPGLVRGQITARKQSLFRFMDRWTTITLPRAFKFSGFRRIVEDRYGKTSLYSDDLFAFPEMLGLQSLIHKSNGIKLQFCGNTGGTVGDTTFLLSSMNVPTSVEGEVVDRDFPNLNFFNKKI